MSFSDVSSVSSHFVTPNEGFSTTTSGTVASGATSVGLNSVTGMTNGTVFVGVIEPAGTKEQIFTGVVDTSGSQITSVVWTKGSNIDHAAGVSVVDYDTGTALKMMTKGIGVEHNQSGTHKAITGLSINVTGALTGTSLVNATHTHATAAQGGPVSNALMSVPYKFRAYRNAAANTGNGAFAVVAFDTEQYDTGANHSAAGVFTAPIAGFYRFSWHILISNSGTTQTTVASLFVNGTQTSDGDQTVSTNVTLSTGGDDTIQLAANDTVDIRVFCTTTQPLSVGNTYKSYWSGSLVGAT